MCFPSVTPNFNDPNAQKTFDLFTSMRNNKSRQSQLNVMGDLLYKKATGNWRTEGSTFQEGTSVQTGNTSSPAPQPMPSGVGEIRESLGRRMFQSAGAVQNRRT